MTIGALNGVRILDCSRILAGPYCTMVLSDYGAEVIKVEKPGSGDGTRQWGPPWVGGESAYFLSVNRNKRSITLNLKHATGRSILRRLAASADVLIENFKPGTMRALDLHYEALREHNPGLVYCSISGFGQDGPDRDRAGYDFMIQAQGGIMSITGPADGEPHKVGVAIVDITAGLFAANAILAALHHRTQTGRGQYIDVALLDAQIGWLANVAQNYFATGRAPRRFGNAHPNIVPYETLPTADGHLALAVGSDDQFRRLCQVVERPELWAEALFRTNAGRVAHRDRLVPQLRAAFRTRVTSDWLQRLVAADIPAGPINDIPTILADPQIVARQVVQDVEHPSAGPIKLIGPVAKLSETPARIYSAPPVLGASTSAVLRDLGYADDQIASWREEGVI